MKNSIEYHYKVTNRIISLDWEHLEMQAMMKRETILPLSGGKIPRQSVNRKQPFLVEIERQVFSGLLLVFRILCFM